MSVAARGRRHPLVRRAEIVLELVWAFDKGAEPVIPLGTEGYILPDPGFTECPKPALLPLL